LWGARGDGASQLSEAEPEVEDADPMSGSGRDRDAEMMPM
jgi:hypothetical protein